MIEKQSPVVVVSNYQPGKFNSECERLVELGYKMATCGTGIDADADPTFMAIFVLPEIMVGALEAITEVTS